MSDEPLTLAERHAAEMLSQGDQAAAIEAADWADRERPEPPPYAGLGTRMRARFAKGACLDGHGAGITEKQMAILGGLVSEGADHTRRDECGLSARDLEPMLARSLNRNFVGWGSGDITVTLHRLMQKGLVERRECERTKLRDPQWRWFATKRGSAVSVLYLAEKGYVTDEEAVEIRTESGWAAIAPIRAAGDL